MHFCLVIRGPNKLRLLGAPEEVVEAVASVLR